MSIVRARLTFANVVSVIAVFLALGGGAVAIERTADRGKPKAERSTAATVGPGEQEARASKKKAKRGPPGPQGPQGLQGAPGAPGSVADLAFGETRVTFANIATQIRDDGAGGFPTKSAITTGPLPAGSYAVLGVVNVVAFASNLDIRGACVLNASSGPGSDSHEYEAEASTTLETPRETITLMYTTTIPAGAVFKLECSAGFSGNSSQITSLINRKIVPIRLKSQLQESVTPVDAE